MANAVVINEKKVWITNKNGKRISKIYHFVDESNIKVTKNFLGITTCNRLIGKNIKLQSLKKMKIININTLKVVYEEKLESPSIFPTLYNYVYFNPQNNTIYDTKNTPILNKVIYFYYVDIPNELLIVRHSTDKFSIIKKDSVSVQDADHVLVNGYQIFTIKDGVASLCDLHTMDCISKVEISKAKKYTVQPLCTSKGTKAIYINYYSNNIKREIRCLQDLTKVIKLSELEHVPIGSIYPRGFLAITCYKSYAIESDEIGSKIFDLINFKYLSEEVAKEHFILYDYENKEYLVLKYTDKISVYSLPNYNLIMSDNYTNISISKDKDHFILENGDLKGVAKLNGKVILEPITPCLQETPNSFFYSDNPLKEIKKASTDKPEE